VAWVAVWRFESGNLTKRFDLLSAIYEQSEEYILVSAEIFHREGDPRGLAHALIAMKELRMGEYSSFLELADRDVHQFMFQLETMGADPSVLVALYAFFRTRIKDTVIILVAIIVGAVYFLT
jgi:hypothetical protein